MLCRQLLSVIKYFVKKPWRKLQTMSNSYLLVIVSEEQRLFTRVWYNPYGSSMRTYEICKIYSQIMYFWNTYWNRVLYLYILKGFILYNQFVSSFHPCNIVLLIISICCYNKICILHVQISSVNPENNLNFELNSTFQHSRQTRAIVSNRILCDLCPFSLL